MLKTIRIAYVSYEHPLGIASGGIGTYIGHISKIMAMRKHNVEVFSGTSNPNSSTMEFDGYKLHLIATKDKSTFKASVLPVFAASHNALAFDMIESPEYGADGLEIKKAFPSLPLVLKLHTPSFLVGNLNSFKNTYFHKARFIIGGLLRLQPVKFYWRYDKKTDPEYELFNLAESVVSPSVSLSEIIKARWGSKKKIPVIPNPFPINKNSKTNYASGRTGIVITFIGKLEKRKGILDLMKAIPQTLKSFPKTTFLFVGNASPSPTEGLDMIEYMRKKLRKFKNSLIFSGFQPHDKISTILEESDICIFPSLWENFPYVCLEAMAKGKAVIGTNNGGMAEIITHNFNGLLIPPGSPKDIIEALKKLISNPHLIDLLGKAAMETLATQYNSNIIGNQTEDLYINTICAND